MGRNRMKRGSLYLVVWDEAAAKERADALAADGWDVRTEHLDGARALMQMRDDPPDVVAIDLSRLPSHGRETARAVRTQKDLRNTPIVFFGGTEEVTTRALGVVPGAHHTTPDELPHVLARLTLRATK